MLELNTKGRSISIFKDFPTCLFTPVPVCSRHRQAWGPSEDRQMASKHRHLHTFVSAGKEPTAAARTLTLSAMPACAEEGPHRSSRGQGRTLCCRGGAGNRDRGARETEQPRESLSPGSRQGREHPGLTKAEELVLQAPGQARQLLPCKCRTSSGLTPSSASLPPASPRHLPRPHPTPPGPRPCSSSHWGGGKEMLEVAGTA